MEKFYRRISFREQNRQNKGNGLRMQIRHIYQLQTTDRGSHCSVRLCERSGPITECCLFAPTLNLSCERCLLKHHTNPWQREALLNWLMFWTAQKPALQVFDLFDQLHFCSTPRVTKFVVLKYHEIKWQLCKYYQKSLKFSTLLTPF